MVDFFIERPNFAWVIALFIVLAGALTLGRLPVSQYPDVAPPQISVSASYPGASAQIINLNVTSLLEEELNGLPDLLYYESTSANGSADTTVTFKPGTDPDRAQIDVQNRLQRVVGRLPQAVIEQGLKVEQVRANFLMIYALSYTDEQQDSVGLADFAARAVNNEIRRVAGVGRVEMYTAERAMRIWVDPAELVGYGLSMADVSKAIAAQNVQVPAGSMGERPGPVDQQITATVMVQGQLESVEAFGNIVLRANDDGASVRIHDVARVELGRQDYRFDARLNGKPVAAMSVQLAPGGNALQTAQAVKARLEHLSSTLPGNMRLSVPYDTAPFVQAAIKQVVYTLIEAMVLVFLVMWLFLQKLRYTLIPAVVVPVCLSGTLAVMGGAGVFHQYDDAVRHGAGHRHAGGRCHCRGGKRRALDQPGASVAQGRDPQGHASDQRSHCRHYPGAGNGVFAAGLHGRFGGRDLPAVRPSVVGVDSVLRVPRADPDSGAVCGIAEAF